MEGKYKIKWLRILILVIAASLSMGVIECPRDLGRIEFKNYSDSPIALFVDTLYITTLKQNQIERWGLEVWQHPYFTLHSHGRGRFDLAPYCDSISRDTVFLRKFKVTARIDDSVIYEYIFPPVEKVPYIGALNILSQTVDTVIVFGDKSK